MRSSPLVSVLMSVYNGEPYLRLAVESILNQTFTDFEFIMVDDGSTDSTWSVLIEYAPRDSRVVVVRNEKNIGLTRSLNKALALAKGKYIARQDADDLSLSERLEKQVSYLESHSSVGLLGTSYEVISNDGQVLTVERMPTQNKVLQKKLLNQNCFGHGSVVIRRVCFDRVGSYRTAFKYAQDYDLWLRIAEHFEVANLSESLYQYRVHLQSINARQVKEVGSFGKMANCLSQQRRQYNQESIYLDDRNNLPHPEPEALAQEYLWYAHVFYLSGDEKSAAEYWGHAQDNYDVFGKNITQLSELLVNYAMTIVDQSCSFETGVRFLSTLLSGQQEPNRRSRDLERKTLSLFHFHAALRSLARGAIGAFLYHLVIALKNDIPWFRCIAVLYITAGRFVRRQTIERVQRGVKKVCPK